MSVFVDVVESNPVVFVKEIIEAMKKGFYIENTLRGCVVVGIPFSIRLFEQDKPELKHELPKEIKHVVIEGWDWQNWLLDVQNAVLQGFELDERAAYIEHQKIVTFSRGESLSGQYEATEEKVVKPKRQPKPKTEKGDA